MNREKIEKLNTLIALLNQGITIICGFILPRYYLKSYGSEVYGLVSSISQFLGFVTLMELGVGAVVQSSLYKPLAQKDQLQISRIIDSADKFFKKIASIFLIYTLVLAAVYPCINSGTFDWWFEFSLVIIISISSFAEYYFGITYRLLLLADQKAYVTYGLSSIAIIGNLIICVSMMHWGFSIHMVKLTSTIVLLLRPLGQQIYVKRNYQINSRIQYTGEPIKQKWNGIAQHIAYFITNNTDTIVLTLFSTFQNIAIYSVYNMVVNGFRQLILTLNSGTKALYGELIAKDELVELSQHFVKYEVLIHAVVVTIYSCIFKLILPFVSIYTSGITDIDYIQPTFAVLITLAHAIYCIRLPYNTLIGASGHYKETQLSAVIEMILNLTISIALVIRYGLVGVAIGTVVALTFRTVYLGYYAKYIIPSYRFKSFAHAILVDLIEVIIILLITDHIVIDVHSYIEWIVYASIIFFVIVSVVIVVNYTFNRNKINQVFKSILSNRKVKL